MFDVVYLRWTCMEVAGGNYQVGVVRKFNQFTIDCDWLGLHQWPRIQLVQCTTPDVCPTNTVQCERSLRTSTIQLYTVSGMSRWLSLSNRAVWRSMSHALLKSSEMTMTYGLDRSMLVIMWSRLIMVTVVEPVGRNANYSEKFIVGDRHRKAG